MTKGIKNVQNLGELILPEKYIKKYEIERIKVINNLIPPVKKYKSSKNALDIGTGVGFFARILLQKGYNPTGIDLSNENIKLAKSLNKNIKFEVGDICKLNYPDNSFDLILCLEVIEHLKNYKGALEEIQRVLTPNGYLIISTPNKLSMEGLVGKILEKLIGKKWNAWDETHQKIFSSLEFIKLLRKEEFKIRSIDGYYYLPFRKLQILNFVTYANFSKKPLNYLGFNTIVKCTKIK